jgi:hypothetical protein
VPHVFSGVGGVACKVFRRARCSEWFLATVDELCALDDEDDTPVLVMQDEQFEYFQRS